MSARSRPAFQIVDSLRRAKAGVDVGAQDTSVHLYQQVWVIQVAKPRRTNKSVLCLYICKALRDFPITSFLS